MMNHSDFNENGKLNEAAPEQVAGGYVVQTRVSRCPYCGREFDVAYGNGRIQFINHVDNCPKRLANHE